MQFNLFKFIFRVQRLINYPAKKSTSEKETSEEWKIVCYKIVESLVISGQLSAQLQVESHLKYKH